MKSEEYGRTSSLVLVEENWTSLDEINAARVVPKGVLLVRKQGAAQGPTQDKTASTSDL